MKLIVDIPDEDCAFYISMYNGTPLEEELEKIKEEIYRHHNITCNFKCENCFLEYNCELRRIDLLGDLAIIDKHISELKGVNQCSED